MIDVISIINNIDKRRAESIAVDKPICKCGNTTLFNYANYKNTSIFICDDCDIDVYVRRT